MLAKKAIAFILSVTLIFGITGTVYGAEKESKAAKSSVTTSVASVNTTYSSKITNYDTAKRYQFSLSKDGYINVDFTHNYVDTDSTYWYVEIYNGSMQKLTSQDIAARDMKTALTKIGLPAGTYYLQIGISINNEVNQPYQFRINYKASSDWETEFNDTDLTADALPVNTVRYGTSMVYDDKDYFKLDLKKAGYVGLTFTHNYVDTYDNYWYVEIYNSSMKLLTGQAIRGDVTKTALPKIGLPAGTYYVKITGRSYRAVGVPYNIKANFTASSAWETEFNNTYRTADPISLNGTRYGTSMLCEDYNYDDDYYKLKADKTGYVAVSLSHGYVDDYSTFWILSLYNSSMKLLKDTYVDANKTNVSLPKIKVVAGKTYYIRVHGWSYSGVGKQYTLKPVYYFTKSTPAMKTIKTKKKRAYLSWNKVSGASGYQVYMSAKNNKHYKLIKTTKSVKYTKKSLKKDKNIISKPWHIKLLRVRNIMEVMVKHGAFV